MELGRKIPKSKWPKYYMSTWGVTNLYKTNLGPDWRLMYTLAFDGAGVAVICLEVLPHKDYDRQFGYKTT